MTTANRLYPEGIDSSAAMPNTMAPPIIILSIRTKQDLLANGWMAGFIYIKTSKHNRSCEYRVLDWIPGTPSWSYPTTWDLPRGNYPRLTPRAAAERRCWLAKRREVRVAWFCQPQSHIDRALLRIGVEGKVALRLSLGIMIPMRGGPSELGPP